MERLTQRPVRDQDMVFVNGMMAPHIEEIGKMVSDTVKELSDHRGATSIKVNGSMTSDMDLA
jgi:hypothetical protein